MSRKNLEAKKRHHYVWANYLARWARGTKSVFYTTKTGKIAYDSVRGIAADDYFYKSSTLTEKDIEVINGLSQLSPSHLQKQHVSYLNDFLKVQNAEACYRRLGIHVQDAETHLHAVKCNLLENLHASHEKVVIPLIAALADGKVDVLQNGQNMLEFMAFFGHQISRTKPFRDAVIQSQPRANAAEIEIAESMEHAWWFLSYMFGMNIGFSLYSGRHAAKHALLMNDTKVPFITSDNPIINVHPCVLENRRTPPEHGDFYYPISPRIAYIICDSDRFTQGRVEINETIAMELNNKMASNAMIHIIGDSDKALHPYQKLVGRRYQ